MATNEKPYPTITPTSSRTLDLRVIEQQLGQIESALLAAHYHLKYQSDALERQTADAIDTLLTLKKSFGFVSPVKPVQERESAIIEQKNYL